MYDVWMEGKDVLLEDPSFQDMFEGDGVVVRRRGGGRCR